MKQEKQIAYFSMEFAIDDKIPNYAGGLGILAADILYSAADMEVPMVGVSLIYHKSEDKKKTFNPEEFMEKLPQTVSVKIENREVTLAIYKMEIKGRTGFIVPVYFLSTNLLENPIWDRNITKHLYASDPYTRLGQEFILGVGGVRALSELEHEISCYHMNEGHSALLTLELLRKYNDADKVRSKCTFTTHTPIPAGHDYFDYDLSSRMLGSFLPENIKEYATDLRLGMTQLALNLSQKSNSVAEKHQEVCTNMFPGFKFENITNGVYHLRWTSDAFTVVYDKCMPEWRDDPGVLAKAPEMISDEDICGANAVDKKVLIDWINSNKEFFAIEELIDDDYFDEETLTIGFARRCVPYKRTNLIFHNLNELRKIGYKKIQLIFANRCADNDAFCHNMREQLYQHSKDLRGQIKVAVVPDYNIEIAKKLLFGSDVWLNNPIPPLEASGTSGMKAAVNAGLNLSVLDGWWIEGFKMNPKTGWGFGKFSETFSHQNRDDKDAYELYRNLEDVVDCYYNRKEEWADRMKQSLGLISYFNTHRVVQEYVDKMWCYQKDEDKIEDIQDEEGN